MSEGALTTTSSQRQEDTSAGEGQEGLLVQLPLISWTLIENEFNAQYTKVFLGRNSKAHFDFLNEIVDGAKERWRTVQLLDALLCLVYGSRPTDHRSNRRIFEHHEVFRDAVLKAMEAAYDEAYGIRAGHVLPAGSIIKGISQGILCDIRPPWTDFATLRTAFLSQTERSAASAGFDTESRHKGKGFLRRQEIIGASSLLLLGYFLQKSHPPPPTHTHFTLAPSKDAMAGTDVFRTHSLPQLIVRGVERLIQLNSAGPEVEAPADFGDAVRLRAGNRFVVVAPAGAMKEFLRAVPPSSTSAAAAAAARRREQESAPDMEFEIVSHDPAADKRGAGKGSRAKRKQHSRTKEPAALFRVLTNEAPQVTTASSSMSMLEAAAGAGAAAASTQSGPPAFPPSTEHAAWTSFRPSSSLVGAGAGAGASGFTLSLPQPANARGSERLKRPPQDEAFEYTDVQAREDGELPRPRHRRKGPQL